MTKKSVVVPVVPVAASAVPVVAVPVSPVAVPVDSAVPVVAVPVDSAVPVVAVPVDSAVPVSPVAVPVDSAVPVAASAGPAVPVAVAVLPFAILQMLTAPKTKTTKEAQKIKVEKKTLKDLDDQFMDFLAFSLSFFGHVVSLSDIKSKVALSQDFDDKMSSLLNFASVGAVDKDANYAGKLIFTGDSVISLTDYQVFAYSKSYSEDKSDKNHQGIYCWQVQKFIKVVLIAQAVKSQKSLEIAPPASCPFISLSWASFAACFLALGCQAMDQAKINLLKKYFDPGLIDHLDALGLLLDIDLTFASILALGNNKPVSVPVPGK